MRILLIAVTIMFLNSSAHSETIIHLDAPAAAELLSSAKEKPTVLDVRTAEEFAEGHLPHAKNIDFRKSTFADQLAKLDKSKPYLVHCRSGGRSTKSLALFKKLGFEKIYHLDGGFLAWEKAQEATEK